LLLALVHWHSGSRRRRRVAGDAVW
jgi:hypothetical protein